jgi:uncharacterized protein
MTTHRIFLTACWRYLAVLNFTIDARMLEPYLPRRTELDLWNGAALVSLVGFRFLDTKVLGVSVPFHRDFDEVNLRFYVRGPEGRGVVFIKEFVPKRAVAMVARELYGENYAATPMNHSIDQRGNGLRVSYDWQWRGTKNFIAVEAEGDPGLPADGSADAFIFEHYWGYGPQVYRVEHPSWRVWRVTQAQLSIDGDGLYGAGFGEIFSRPPVSAMLAEGSEVSVFRGAAKVGD